MQEEWDAIPLEDSARSSSASAVSASAAAAPQPSAISYDDALAALVAVDMSAAAARAVVYEAPASCFGRMLHCFSRPSLQIQNADEELRLPFLLALTPFDGCVAALLCSPLVTCRDACQCSSNATHMAMMSTFYCKITGSTRAVDRIGRCSAAQPRKLLFCT